MALADVHILGSRSGYTTLAAGLGVGADERRELELLQFGELGTSAMAAQLASQPMALGRMLSSGRYALSRVCASESLDDAGRPTIEVVTIVLDRAALGEVAASLSTIVRDNDLWTRVRAQPEAPASIAATRAAAVEIDASTLQLFDAWACAVGSRRVAVVSAEHADAVLRLFALLDPEDRLQCRWGIGMMSPAGAVDLCALRVGGSSAGARESVRPMQPGAFHLPELMAPVAARTRTTRHALLARATAERLSNSVAHDPSWNTSSAARQSSGFSWGPRRTAVAMAVLSTLVLGAAIGVTLAKKPATEDVANEDEVVDRLSWGGMLGEGRADGAVSADSLQNGTTGQYGFTDAIAMKSETAAAVGAADTDVATDIKQTAETGGTHTADQVPALSSSTHQLESGQSRAASENAETAHATNQSQGGDGPSSARRERSPEPEDDQAAGTNKDQAEAAGRAHQALDQLTNANRELRASFKSVDQVAELTPQAWAAWVEARMERLLRVAFEIVESDAACKADVDANSMWKDSPDAAVEELESDGGFLFLWNPPKERRSRPSIDRVRAWSELAEQFNEERIILQRAFKNEGDYQEELERRAKTLRDEIIRSELQNLEESLPPESPGAQTRPRQLKEREKQLARVYGELLVKAPWLMLTERRLELERGRIARYLKEATP
jgi:hypothetical protein